MRKAMLFLTVFALAGSLWAADPIVGTWKLNVAKSNIPPSETPKERIEVYREINAGLMEYTGSGTNADGSAITGTYTWPRQGGTAKRVSPDPLPKGESIVETLIEPGNWCASFLEGGSQTSIILKTISKDGKTMRQILRFLDAKGKMTEVLSVFERQ
jgi:hypothetical protein